MKKQGLALSFKAAAGGFIHLVANERNARIELGFAAAAIALGFWSRLNALEWSVVTLCIGSVLGAEAMNSALESLADALHPKHHPKVGLAKDLAAAAVLCVAWASLAVGILLFGPKLGLF